MSGGVGGGATLVCHVLVASSVLLAVVPSVVLAHGDGGGLHGLALPAGVFLTGVVVLGASVALDAGERLDPRYVDAGMLAGALCVIASIVIFWI